MDREQVMLAALLYGHSELVCVGISSHLICIEIGHMNMANAFPALGGVMISSPFFQHLHINRS